MNVYQGIFVLLGLVTSLQLVSCRQFFRRYHHYNRFMKKMALNFEKAKVETLGAIFKRHVQQLRHTHNKQVELVFLIDSSGTVGRQYFYEEVRFVKNLLADFTVDMNSTRVSVITFSSPHKIYRHIDYLTHPHTDNHKCRLLHEDIPDVIYTPGGTHTLGALLEAEKVLRAARVDSTKAIFLMTDGYSNGGDPRPVARKLKEQGVKIFTFGIRDGFVWELQDMASNPKNETCYILDSFEEFEALAKRALHADLQSGTHIAQSVSKCGRLCNNGDKCCHNNATCTCGTYTGKYECLCNPGYYGTGRGKTGCKPCPPGTYKNVTGQGSRTSCIPCPDENQVTPAGAQSEKQCACKRGYRSFGSKSCTVARCSELEPPKHGYFINSKCNNVFNAACGLRCNSGYELHGSSLRICQEDGTWSGQTAKCIMKTCPSLHQPKNGHMICSTDDFSYSTVCRFTCNNGYQLVGSRKRTCLAIAFWTGIATRCREITCPPLTEIKDGDVSPPSCLASEVVFGTVCQISCSSGYSLKGPHTKQCTPDGTWMAPKAGRNQCLDDTPPVLHCPDDTEIMADEEEDTTEVVWREPVPVDNSGLIPLLTTEPAVSPGSRFPIGATTITYRAEDLSTNIATCSFKLNVIDKTPPRIDRCPTPPHAVSKGERTAVILEAPEFSDNSGKTVKYVASKASDFLFPIGTTRVIYTASDTSNNNSTCEVDVVVVPHLCGSPKPPNNGNVSCEEGQSGVTCTISCKEGFTFIDPIADEYLCDMKTGVWMPDEFFPPPDCAVVQDSNDILQPATVTLTGDISCQDQKSLLEIAENLEEEMKEKLSLLCADNGLSCSLNSLHSVCEDEENFNKIPVVPIKKRKKRHLRNRQRSRRSADNTYLFHIRHRRSSKARKSKISFDFTLKGSLAKTDDSQRTLEVDFSKALDNLLSSLQTKAKKMLATNNKTVKIEEMSYDVDNAKYNCPEGSLLTNKTCIYCPVGTFHNSAMSLCEDCPKGTYQDKEGQTSCIRCPDNQSTGKTRCRNIGECKAICKPGTFSITGLEPCDTCHQGFYESNFSSKKCFPCNNGKTTQRRGCTSEEKCAELCPAGHASQNGLVPCLPCPTTAYQPKLGQTECLLCPAGGSTGIRGATSLSSCIMPSESWQIQSDGTSDSSIPFNECDFENPCQNGGVCKKGEGLLFTCECPDGFGGETCKDVINHCKSEPCLNNGGCVLSNGSFSCDCVDGFTGATCDVNVDDCVPNRCQNEATCEDGINSFACRCKPGYTGSVCETRINECEDEPCLNGGSCTVEATGVSCQCPSGFSGQLCEVDLDECLGYPCINNATCVDLPGDFRCECIQGYTGKSCDINIDECAFHNPCENGGTCVDGINDFMCQCVEGFYGTNCEEELTPYYQLDFVNPSIMDYAQLHIDRPLNSVTASLWVKTTDDDNQGTPFSYGVKGQPDAFTITDYRNLNVYINGEQRSTVLSLNDGQWQHFVFTWSNVHGNWKFYINGILMDQGYDLSTSKAIPGKGVFIIGQEQDEEGGGFSAGETFAGSLTQLNIWDKEFSLDEIEKLRFSCEAFHGNVIAWPDVKTALRGDVAANPSSFCEDIQKFKVRYRYRYWADMFSMANRYL